MLLSCPATPVLALLSLDIYKIIIPRIAETEHSLLKGIRDPLVVG